MTRIVDDVQVTDGTQWKAKLSCGHVITGGYSLNMRTYEPTYKSTPTVGDCTFCHDCQSMPAAWRAPEAA